MSDEKSVILMGDRGLQLRTIEDYITYGEQVIESGFAPKGFTKPAAVVVAIQAGAELGLSPQQSLAQMKVVNGRAGPMSRAAKGIIRRAKILKEGTGFREWMEVDGETVENLEGIDPKTQSIVAYIETWRADEPEPQRTSFSWHDAKRAGLTEKDTYRKYPQRMLLHRAASFHFEDHFSDVLLGFTTAEALEDYPDESEPPRDITPTKPEPGPPPQAEVADPLLAGALTTSAPAMPDPEVIEPTGGDSEVTPAAGVTEESPPVEPDTSPPGDGFEEEEEEEEDQELVEAQKRLEEKQARLKAEEEAKAATDAPKPGNAAPAASQEPESPLGIISAEQRKTLWNCAVKRSQGFVDTSLLTEDLLKDCAVEILTMALSSKGYRVVEGKPTPVKVDDYRSLLGRINNAKLPEGLVSTSTPREEPPPEEPGPTPEGDDAGPF